MPSASSGDESANGAHIRFNEAAPDPNVIRGEQQVSASPSSEKATSMDQNVNSYHTQFPDPDWHQIAEKAADEKDPKKLAFLIKALCDRLEELRQSKFREKK